MIVLAYLGAVVAANLTIATFGPAAVLPVAFALVGFNMTARDRLHDSWHGRGLGWKMAALVAVGGLLSFLLNADALRIAVASSVAFAASETVNALVYAPMLRRRVPWLARVNAGNVPNALADSALFIGLAFGPLWGLMLAQAAVKIGGGFVWSLVLRRRVAPRCPECDGDVSVSTRNMGPVPYEWLRCACAEGWGRRLAVALLLLAPVGAHAQIASFGAGVVSTDHGGEWAVDGFLAGAPVLGVRPSAVVSWTGEAAYFAKLSAPLVSNGPAWINADAGVNWLPFRDHAPEPFVGLYFAAPLPLPRTSLHTAVMTEPGAGWGWAVVARVDFTLAFWR